MLKISLQYQISFTISTNLFSLFFIIILYNYKRIDSLYDILISDLLESLKRKGKDLEDNNLLY